MQKRRFRLLVSLLMFSIVFVMLSACQQFVARETEKGNKNLASSPFYEVSTTIASAAEALKDDTKMEREIEKRFSIIEENIDVEPPIEIVEVIEEPVFAEPAEETLYEVVEEVDSSYEEPVTEIIPEPIYTYEPTYETITLPYETLYSLNPQMDNDQGYVIQEGQNGEVVHTWMHTYEDGVLIDSHITKTSQIDAVPEIMMVGSNIVVVPGGSSLEAEQAKIDALPKLR